MSNRYLAHFIPEGGSGPVTVTPPAAVLATTRFAPTVGVSQRATPTTAALTLATFAPTVGAASITVTPATAALTLTTFAPEAGSSQTVVPTTAALVLTGFAPTTSPVSAPPPTLALNWIEQPSFLFELPFNLGGIGTSDFALPFDIEADPYSASIAFPFNIAGAFQESWDLSFDLGETIESTWAFPFYVNEAVRHPSIGGFIGDAGLYLASAAIVGATSVTLNALGPITTGTTIRIGATSEIRVVTGTAVTTASFAAPLLAAYPAGSPVAAATGTTSGSTAVGATTVTLSAVTGLATGAVIQVDEEVRVVSSVAGSVVTVTEPFATAHVSSTPVFRISAAPTVGGVNSPAAWVDGLLIFTKGGDLLGNVPSGWFTIDDAPSRVIGDSGGMAFRMARRDNGPNPYLSLIYDDRLVMVLDDIGSEPWLGSITTQDWGEGQVTIRAADATALWTGPKLSVAEAPSTQLTAAALYAKVLALMNVQRGADNELVWDADISTSEMFFGDAVLEGDAFDLFEEIARRSQTEFMWRASYSGGRARATMIVRTEFTAAGFDVSDGDDGNVESRPRLLVDPTPIVNAVRVRGKATDLSSDSGSCSTSGDIDCLDWMTQATGVTSPTTLIPEGFASIEPGVRRRREEMLIELDWGMSAPDQQAAAHDSTSQAYALFHSFLRAWHDRFGRPFFSVDGWQYDGPPEDIEVFLNTGLGWRTHLRLIEYRGEPASMVMLSEDQQQALIVLYDLVTGIKTVRRVWFNEADGVNTLTKMLVHGKMTTYNVQGGVVVGSFAVHRDHAEHIVGPPATYVWPADGTKPTTYHTLRRILNLTEVWPGGQEGTYVDSSMPTGPTTGVWADPPANTIPFYQEPTIGDAPYKSFERELRVNVIDDMGVSKVYDFENRSLCDWDPRRDGVGALLTKTTIRTNTPTTSPRWHFVPWGDGSGTTALTTGIDENETIIFVDNAFVLPQNLPYTAVLGSGLASETVQVTAADGNRLTLVRGFNGTTAIFHQAGAQFAAKEDCDQEPEQPSDTTQIVPWPEGDAFAAKVLARASRPVRRLTAEIVNQNAEWAQVQPGSLIEVDIQSEGPPEGITGTWRVLGWAPSYHDGVLELLTEEWFG